MTIVAVLKGSDDVLYLGADTQWTDSEGLKFFQSKLKYVYDGEKVLAWASAGNPQIGFTEFAQWVDASKWSAYETWTEFIVEVAKEFARLNRIRKEIGEQAGNNVEDKDFIAKNMCSMLICGRVGNESKAFAVMHDGVFQEIDTLGGGLLTIGTGAPFAEAVFTTQGFYGETLDRTDEQLFSALLSLASRYGPQCNLPYEYIKISSDEVMVFRSEEPELEAGEISPASQTTPSRDE